MNRVCVAVCFLLLLGLHVPGSAQDAHIPPVDIRMEDSLVLITYELQCEDPTQAFHINLVVEHMNGERIPVKAIRGDVNVEVRAGKNRLITWDPAADGVVINADIRVSVHASLVAKPVPMPSEDWDQAVVEKSVPAEQGIEQRDFSRMGLMAQSAVFPGLGLSRYTGQPHWIKGAVAYGCLAGSIILNRTAINTYENQYLDAGTESQAALWLSRAHAQDKTSELMAYSALLIWMSDLVWTFVLTRDLKNVNFTGYLDPFTLRPMVGFVYRFPPGD